MHWHLHKKRNKPRGFTLLEMVVVLAIIGMLAALVGPRLFGTLDKGQRQTALAQIQLIATGLDLYRLDMGRLPNTEEGLNALITPPASGDSAWQGPYLRAQSLPLDPWGQPYQYTAATDAVAGYEILSYGADGKAGGTAAAADIKGP